jgi:hypothetical protein
MFLLLLACEKDPIPTVDCEVTTVIGTVDHGPTDRPIRSDLAITGTLSADVAVRSIIIGNRPAIPVTDNFGTWSAVLPIATLVTLAATAGDTDGDGLGSVTLEATATDTCGQTHTIGSPFQVDVDLSPEVIVSSLDVDVQIPSGKSYVPKNGSAVAVLNLSADKDAAGASVVVKSSIGQLQADEDGVTLAGDGEGLASATVLFYATATDEEGTALITATAEDQVATTTVKIAGPPRLSPETLSLEAGQQEIISVYSQGSIDSCVAYAETTSAIEVSENGGDTLFGRVVSDTDGDGWLELLVKVNDNLTEAATVQIRCCDVYNQCTSDGDGIYAVTPVAE